MLVALAVLSVAATAHAEIRLEAWNRDGTAALVTGMRTMNLIEKERVVFFVMIVKPDVKAVQEFDFRDTSGCATAPARLRKSLAKEGFTGIGVRSDGCERPGLVIAPSVQRATQRSWIAIPHARDGTPREQDALAAAQSVDNDGDCEGFGAPGDFDVAAMTKRLYLVLASCSNDPLGANVFVVTREGDEMNWRYHVPSD